ncbi:MAG: S41 family peptidase [Balneolaceae bacterium]|nr:S41 family peptidase [Balneolaceae bacterium]MBO6545480.1 S41 family peptidase [Balneolaceae bacterium]MBO6646876.1 S41 family peptidase [Balneolaceae bacterium]
MNRIRALLILSFLFAGLTAEARQVEELKFDENRLGRFASNWFLAVNKANPEFLDNYMEKEWRDYLDLLISHVQSKEGITPYKISYQTDKAISIYSKENNSGWVKVNLALNKERRISLMEIKKSVLPVEYDLSKQVTELQRKELIKDLEKKLSEKYVIPQKGKAYSTELKRRYDEGDFKALDQGDLLAEKLTEQLVDISGDKHLEVIPPSRINEVNMRFGKTEEMEDVESDQYQEEIIRSSILEKNVGLIKIDRFVDSEEVREKTKTELERLKHTKALIIDLRSSGGGDGKAVENLLSYFYASNNSLSKVFYNKPIAVLTSGKTISAGEALCYDIQNKNRGIIVGERTAGAGFLVNVFELVYGFYAVISTDTNFDIEKKEGWQGRGIIPDVGVSSGKALEMANEILSKRS